MDAEYKFECRRINSTNKQLISNYTKHIKTLYNIKIVLPNSVNSIINNNMMIQYLYITPNTLKNNKQKTFSICKNRKNKKHLTNCVYCHNIKLCGAIFKHQKCKNNIMCENAIKFNTRTYVDVSKKMIFLKNANSVSFDFVKNNFNIYFNALFFRNTKKIEILKFEKNDIYDLCQFKNVHTLKLDGFISSLFTTQICDKKINISYLNIHTLHLNNEFNFNIQRKLCVKNLIIEKSMYKNLDKYLYVYSLDIRFDETSGFENNVLDLNNFATICILKMSCINTINDLSVVKYVQNLSIVDILDIKNITKKMNNKKLLIEFDSWTELDLTNLKNVKYIDLIRCLFKSRSILELKNVYKLKYHFGEEELIGANVNLKNVLKYVRNFG